MSKDKEKDANITETTDETNENVSRNLTDDMSKSNRILLEFVVLVECLNDTLVQNVEWL
ncbi:46121_t:CDS:2 [Gigaspora margarita]|uniref:46121_t:CDS:1 n=1 Tax=Gigaspora margarita TaxID=4874 RepID=A0ABM8W6F3_GIGMA|nr:46121_t:CDS:2 [Gigaspora margarita]